MAPTCADRSVVVPELATDPEIMEAALATAGAFVLLHPPLPPFLFSRCFNSTGEGVSAF